MSRGLLIVVSAGLMALGIPLSGMSSLMGTSHAIGISSRAALSQQVEQELTAANQAGVLAESAVINGKRNVAISETEKLVGDLARVQTTWRQGHGTASTLMTSDLMTTMNTVLGVRGELETVGWVGTGPLVKSLTASWNASATLLRLARVKNLGTTSYSTVLPTPTVTTVTTMPSATVATAAPLSVTSFTSQTPEQSGNRSTDQGDKGHSKHKDRQNQRKRGRIHPGHKPKHHQHDHH